MGRGISEHQKQILGLGALISDVAGKTPGIEGADCETFDVIPSLCIHYVWGIPISDRLQYKALHYELNGSVYFRNGYEADNPGCFDMSQPGVNAAKVAASKAIRRLCERNLLLECDGRGYLITSDGYALGSLHKPTIPESVIKQYLEAPSYRRLGLRPHSRQRLRPRRNSQS